MNQDFAHKDRFFDLRALASYSSLSVSTLRAHIVKGLPAYKVDGKILVKKSHFNEWIERYKIAQFDVNELVNGVLDRRAQRVSG